MIAVRVGSGPEMKVVGAPFLFASDRKRGSLKMYSHNCINFDCPPIAALYTWDIRERREGTNVRVMAACVQCDGIAQAA